MFLQKSSLNCELSKIMIIFGVRALMRSIICQLTRNCTFLTFYSLMLKTLPPLTMLVILMTKIRNKRFTELLFRIKILISIQCNSIILNEYAWLEVNSSFLKFKLYYWKLHSLCYTFLAAVIGFLFQFAYSRLITITCQKYFASDSNWI